ncbi:hypothetical protein BO70DRAFT_391948 [Aspergillus heteromorphus CBS 117.55]|uniref:Camp independent regulatory protein n=1 Tax=Aspergillus heteromorphus CBS 117.55 TaxID=1448321 RepID=A0A317X6P2_9EURO|nr:uncharacterized protein BO70DRAFT_391948 [Aspergillus heteromorphus CBS 117.55]PWY92548.1 hypothetical protein BO70DRAFT_391948 [Aspergillus heteromorphus CBS 117.55]
MNLWSPDRQIAKSPPPPVTILHSTKPPVLALKPPIITGTYTDHRRWMETYHGHVRTPADAIILFEACRIGLLPRVQRRLSEKERQLIRSGSVFVWDEREAGMRRWTDGKSWSASRVSGSFLTYREMEGKRGGTGVSQSSMSRAGKTPESTRGSDDDRADGADEGPDGYRYKPDGLMKQSFSITTSAGQHLHLISYYSRSHPSAANLQQPSTDPNLRHVRPQKGLYPESTVNDQQNLPVVTRGPMPGAAYPSHAMAPYGRTPITHPTPYTPSYPWPPTPLATPPVPAHHYPSYLPPVPAANGQVPYGHQAAVPPGTPLPPPQPGLPMPHERPVHTAEVTMPLQPAAVQVLARSPRVPPGSGSGSGSHELLHRPSPPELGPPGELLRMSPRTQPHVVSHGNGIGPMVRSPRLLSQPPSNGIHIPPPSAMAPKPLEASSAGGTTVPSIGLLMNGAASGSLPAIAAPPAPAAGRAEGPRDIPSDKIGFGGEDMRALRQLDRVFTA